jgi:TPR repeat protein
MLALMYRRGDGVVVDNSKALALLLKASSQGNGDASYLASNFYSLPEYGLPLDFEKATTLLNKSARDGSEIGQLTLGNNYFNGAPGFKRDVQDAYEQLAKIGDGPYRDAAALTLYKIYALPNQPLYSPSKAAAEMERLATNTKKTIFLSQLAGIYAGKEFVGDLATKNPEKLNALISEYDKPEARQTAVLMKFQANLLPPGQLLPNMVEAIKQPALDSVFAEVFCRALGGLYIGEGRDPSLDLNDIIKACHPMAEQNNNYAQYVLAAAYNSKGEYDNAFKWAYVSSGNGNKFARSIAARIGNERLGARLEDVAQEAESLQRTLKNAKAPAVVIDYTTPWYAPAASTVQ